MTTFTEMYASVAGAGAHDGTSAANAWTMAEATAGVSASDRVNCLAGTYIANDTTSEVIDLDVAGGFGTWIEWRAYTTTIGDFSVGDAQPVVIDANTNSLVNPMNTQTVTGAFNRFIGFQFTGGSGHGVDGSSSTDHISFLGCKFDNNDQRAVIGDDSHTYISCEFTLNTVGAFDIDSNSVVVGCVFHNNGVSTACNNHLSSPVYIDCLWFNNGNGTLIRFTAGGSVTVGCAWDGEGGASATAINSSGSQTIPQCMVNNIIYDQNLGINFSNAGIDEIEGRTANLWSSNTTNIDNIADAEMAGIGDIDDTTDTDPFLGSGATPRDYRIDTTGLANEAGVDVWAVTNNSSDLETATQGIDIGPIQYPAGGGGTVFITRPRILPI